MPSRIRSFLLPVAIAFAVTFLFWWPLYRGAGFIGGDLYPYFFPQKSYYADHLKLGQFPLWNDLTGFGYPILGESQTGAAYPFHLVFYYCFDLNTAYNIEHLLHYVICSVAMYLFAKRVGLSSPGAYLASLVFTYGWFPCRACLEWAILTGAWMPVALWCLESFLQTRWWRYAIGLSVAIGLQLLAGHYHLAFITQLLVVTYAAWRIWGPRTSVTDVMAPQYADQRPISATAGLIISLIAGVGLGCVQVFPTWELKQRSSRVVTGGDYDPAYGHLPPMYLTQAVAPWNWYSLLAVDEDNLVRDIAECFAPWHWFGPRHDLRNPNLPYDLDQAIQRCRAATVSTGTNKVEAHFYCGIVPVVLATLLIGSRIRGTLARSNQAISETVLRRMAGFWLLAGLFALIYATGILLPVGRHIPGFSFFRAPGRYGIVMTLAVALFAGEMFSQLLKRVSSRAVYFFLMLLIFGSTCGDLWLVSRMVKYTVMVSPPRIAFREASFVRERLLAEKNPPRLLAPGPNVATLLGISCVPWYLGIAPAEYVDPQYAMPPRPKPLTTKKPTPANPDLLAWLSRSGVTHILNFEPLDETSWQAEYVWKGVDPFLNRVWGREEPIYLYRFRSGGPVGDKPSFPGRAYTADGNGRVVWTDWKNSSSNTRRLRLEPAQGENSKLILTEFAFPGWTVRQGTTPLDATSEGLFRSVDVSDEPGEIVWDYRPHSVYYGAIVTLVTIILLAMIAHVRFWHPALSNRLIRILFPIDQ